MQMKSNSCEYVKWPDATGAPVGATWLVRFVGRRAVADTWRPMEAVDGVPRILIAGPDADEPGDAVVLPTGSTSVELRIADNPETPTVDGGVIDVTPTTVRSTI